MCIFVDVICLGCSIEYEVRLKDSKPILFCITCGSKKINLNEKIGGVQKSNKSTVIIPKIGFSNHEKQTRKINKKIMESM